MRVELYVLEPGSKPRKLNMSYEDYIQPAILWVTENSKSLAEALDVARVAVAGSYVMGLFGGERKSGTEHYAGLVVSDLKLTDGGFYIRLYNMDREYFAPSGLMKRHGVDVYKAYYGGSISPFKCSTLNVIFSSFGEGELKKFIREVIRLNKGVMTEADERRLRRLAEELKAQIDVLRGSHYVIYRAKAVFTACVPEDLNKAVSLYNIAHIECKSAEQAHYYAAVLNYMAYKVISKRRGFVRDQHAKLLIAIATAGLTWKDLPPQLRSEIARLSHELSRRLTWRDYPNQRKALLETARMSEFAQIIKLLERYIEETGKKRRLEEALDFVSSRERK